MFGYLPDMLDHKNGCSYNNAIDNLQEVTYEQNNRKKFAYNPTGFKGVRQCPNGNFRASIRINGRITGLGTYRTAKEAGEAYAAKARELSGNFEDREQWSCVKKEPKLD